jgi:hypothetical protein
MFYFTCSPEHKLFLLFTVLNNEDTNIFWDGELTKQYVSDLRQDLYIYIEEKLKDTKWVIRSRTSKDRRQ